MTKPTIHLNGTSSDDLFAQVCVVLEALRWARDAMRRAAPHGRDYYIQGDQAFNNANGEHVARLDKLTDIMREYEAMAEYIADERDAREARRAK
jgi:hypothetical protein